MLVIFVMTAEYFDRGRDADLVRCGVTVLIAIVIMMMIMADRRHLSPQSAAPVTSPGVDHHQIYHLS